MEIASLVLGIAANVIAWPLATGAYMAVKKFREFNKTMGSMFGGGK